MDKGNIEYNVIEYWSALKKEGKSDTGMKLEGMMLNRTSQS